MLLERANTRREKHKKVSTESSLVPSSHPSACASSSRREQPWVQSRAPGTLGQVWKGKMWSQLCHTQPAVLPNMCCQASCAAQCPECNQLCHLLSNAEAAVLTSAQCRTSCAAQQPGQIQLCRSVPSPDPAVLLSVQPGSSCAAHCPAQIQLCRSVPSPDPAVLPNISPDPAVLLSIHAGSSCIA